MILETTAVARSYSDATGARTTLRLDAATWAAVDFLAKRRGAKNWAGWVHAIPTKHQSNRHADIREAVSAAMLQLCQPMEIRPGDGLSIEAPLLAEAQTLTDAEFNADLDGADTFLDGTLPLDFGGFALRTGTRNGRQCIWIQNAIRNMPHVVLPIPAWVGQLAAINKEQMAQQETTPGTSKSA
jgi:hypothetical protein